MYTAGQIANWFVAYAHASEGDDCDITDLKVQKLLYYAQGHWLANHDQPLFGDKIKAWSHGPVVPTVWHDLKQAGGTVLAAPADFDRDQIDDETDQFLENIWVAYGGYSALSLRTLTHREDPWRDAFAMPGESPEITTGSMRSWFKTHELADA